MKKGLLFILAVLLTASTFAQRVSRIVPVATNASAFNRQIEIGDFIFNKADSTLYYMTVAASPAAHLSTYTAANTAYGVATTALGASIGSLAAEKVTVTDSILVRTSKFYKQTGVLGSLWLSDTLHSLKGFKTGLAGFIYGGEINSPLVAATDSIMLRTTKFYKQAGVTGSVWVSDTVHSVKGFKTGLAGFIYAAEINSPLLAATDSITLRTTKFYKEAGVTGSAWVSDTLHSVKGFQTGLAGKVYGGVVSSPKMLVVPSDTTGLGIPANRGLIIYKSSDGKFYGYNSVWTALY